MAVKYVDKPTYNSWQNMKARCDNPNNPRYQHYGERGITYPSSWKEYKNFRRDMGKRPPGTSLDRINVEESYSSQNCRWATPNEQGRNQRTTVLSREIVAAILYARAHSDLSQRQLSKELGLIFGISKHTIRAVLIGNTWQGD
jgi:hypothetical protein